MATSIQPLMSEKLTTKSAAYRALNQLLSITAGRRWARQTDELKDDPSARIAKCLELTMGEVQEASAKAARDPEGDRMLSQAQRKIDSLRSLGVLARVIQNEVMWD